MKSVPEFCQSTEFLGLSLDLKSKILNSLEEMSVSPDSHAALISKLKCDLELKNKEILELKLGKLKDEAAVYVNEDDSFRQKECLYQNYAYELTQENFVLRNKLTEATIINSTGVTRARDLLLKEVAVVRDGIAMAEQLTWKLIQQNRVLNREVFNLQDKNDLLTTEQERMRDDLERMEDDLERMRDDLDYLDTKNQKANTNLNIAKEELIEMEEKNEELGKEKEEEVKGLKVKQTRQENEIKGMKGELECALRENIMLQGIIREWEEWKQSLECNISLKDSYIEKAKALIKKYRTAVKSQQV